MFTFHLVAVIPYFLVNKLIRILTSKSKLNLQPSKRTKPHKLSPKANPTFTILTLLTTLKFLKTRWARKINPFKELSNKDRCTTRVNYLKLVLEDHRLLVSMITTHVNPCQQSIKTK